MRSIRGVLVITILSLPLVAQARVNPLRIVTDRMLRAEVLITLDTSGSMAWYPNPSWSVGTDCGGNRAGTVDLCGDGQCSGSEGSPSNRCYSDCNLSRATDWQAGSPPQCSPSNPRTSRMFILKRVLRGMLPEIRQSASIGMVSFWQSGYHRYYLEHHSGPSRKVSVFFTRFELQHLGAWDGKDDRPMPGFKWNGTPYTLLSGAGMPVTQDSLYSRSDDSSVETRFRFSDAGLQHNQGGHTWKFRGSYYTFSARPIRRWTYYTSSTYLGPQFVDSKGRRWVHNRFDYRYSGHGINYGTSGKVVENLPFKQTQAAVDASLFNIISKLNSARNGGIWAWGGTPTGPALETARQHYRARQLGTGPYKFTGPDNNATCRPRFVLLLTDGQSNRGKKPWDVARAIYNDPTFSGNPIRTLVVGLPGLPSSAVQELDRTADYGDDGKLNNSKTAYYANNEGALSKVLKEVLLDMVKGDYATTSATVTSSDSGLTTGNLALIPSTEFPGWRGQFKALDLAQYPFANKWDAGVMLQKQAYNKRKLFTGLRGVQKGNPVPLFSEDGVVNLHGGCLGCGSKGLWHVWNRVGTPPADDVMKAFVEWLAGKSKTWKLGPVFRSTPAVVGQPPVYNGVWKHQLYRNIMAARERLIYLPSNDGLLHAFRARDGSEAFAYLSPNLLPALLGLYQQGGLDPDPKKFKWILGSSPRVEDVPDASKKTGWATQLVLTMGAGGEDYVVLDITEPSLCNAAKCELKPWPFRVIAHSTEKAALDPILGETWSVPALFYTNPTKKKIRARMAMGGGYGDQGSEGNYYSFFTRPHHLPKSVEHNGSGAQVEFGALPDTVAAVDPSKSRAVIATYQADLAGRVVRYHRGRQHKMETVLDAGVYQPFYFAPAVYPAGSNVVVMAMASGSADEEKPPAGAESTLYVRSEKNGTIDLTNDNVTCAVSDICSGSGGCPEKVPASCAAPGANAKPVARPLIVYSKVGNTGAKYDMFFLVYEPSTSLCELGSSWLIRIATDGGDQELVSATEYKGVRATGFTTVGGGVDLAITHIGTKGAKAGAFTVVEKYLKNTGLAVAPVVETWKEVRSPMGTNK